MTTLRRLLRCSSCGRHVFADERACPFCRAARAVRTAGIAAALVASACGGNATQTTVADSGPPDAVADANASHDANTEDANTIIIIDAGAPEAAVDASTDVYDPCGAPGCPCCLYRSPPPRLPA